MSSRVHRMPFGAELHGDGVRFRLWAPDANEVSLQLQNSGRNEEVALASEGNGWRQAIVAEAAAGSRYRFRINGELAVPDPASRFQPDDVHGSSEVIDPTAFRWTCTDWSGRPWEDVVFYELHVGTFTAQGTFRAAIDKLPYLADLGVTAIELMPVADFPGGRDWGYDGVSLFAPDASYGRPEDLKAFIDAAHRHGLMVFLDVVYNHFGPEGNYLGVYARRFFNPQRHTPWGAAISFDSPGTEVVRSFFVENALYWLDEFAIDGLRLDAVHAIDDRLTPDILEEIAAAVRARLPEGRHVHLVLENDKNQARYLNREPAGTPRCYVAQWNDDIHHALHVLLTGEGRGYYSDYAEGPLRHLTRCLTEGFAYQGDRSAFRAGADRGEASAHLPPTAFVSFLQNHDQIGNRAFGERLAVLASADALCAGLAMLLLAPSPPLLFMGEEWGSKQPFLFFCDFGKELREAVREGRRGEFAAFPEFTDARARAHIPDPTSADTFVRSKLDWASVDLPEHRQILELTRKLLALRAREIAPRLVGIAGRAGHILALDDSVTAIDWRLGDGSRLSVVANLSAIPAPSPSPEITQSSRDRLLFATHDAYADAVNSPLPAWSVAWWLGETTVET